MKLNFVKYQGAGNDFILIDNRSRKYDTLDVAKLCDPKFGIGADGLMLLQDVEGHDFDMVYYNSDGNTSTMCGNGGRCIVDFAKRLNIIGPDTVFRAVDGKHIAKWREGKVELNMQDVTSVKAIGHDYELNTGSPHYVVFVNNVGDVNVVSEARKIRYNDKYSEEGINVNFVEIKDASTIRVRTYERGVENETLSCGTGVTASAIALAKKIGINEGEPVISIETPGGKLEVKYKVHGGHFSNVWLTGPATKVFEGTIDL
jgi:diaminopimelate epimerase